MQRYLILLLTLGLAPLVQGGEAYKCRMPDGRVLISDAPCMGAKTEKQIQDTASEGNNDPGVGQRRNQAALDASVAAAIASGDLTRARTLANSTEHWKMIADAEKSKNTPATGRTSADLRAERANTTACQSATRSYDIEASSNTNPAAIEAKRQAMNVACGVEDTSSADNQTTTIYQTAPITRRRHQPVPQPCIPGNIGCPSATKPTQEMGKMAPARRNTGASPSGDR